MAAENPNWPAWRGARSAADLSRLTLRFLEGDLDCFPGWMARDTDEETDDILPYLAAACELGWVTTASQPGAGPATSHDGLPMRQRAFVAGFAPQGVLQDLASRLSDSRLWLRSFTPDPPWHEADPWPVAQAGNREYLWVGAPSGHEELSLFREYLGPEARKALASLSYACLVDPEWGQDDLLWPVLVGDHPLPRYDQHPSP